MDPFINHFRSLWQGANLKREGWGLEAEAGIILATSITASVAASAAASRLRLQPLVCNFITVNGIASGFVSLKTLSQHRSNFLTLLQDCFQNEAILKELLLNEVWMSINQFKSSRIYMYHLNCRCSDKNKHFHVLTTLFQSTSFTNFTSKSPVIKTILV